MVATDNNGPNESGGVLSSAHLHKTIYSGTKSYWRTRETVDVHVVEHTDAKVLEVICFSVEKHEEADRLYFAFEQLYTRLDTAELQDRVEEKRADYARMRKRVPVSEITLTLVREAAVLYLLARLVTVETKAPKRKHRGAAQKQLEAQGLVDSAMGMLGEEAPATTGTGTDTETETETETGTESADGVAVAETNAAAATATGDADATADAAAGTIDDGEEGVVDGTAHAHAPVPAFVAPAPVVELKEPRFNSDLIALTGDKTFSVTVSGPTASNPTGVKVLKLEGLMEREPVNISYIEITRDRKKATKKEFSIAVNALRKENEKLNAANSVAQRKAGLAVSSVNGFKSNAYKYDPTKMSKARWRWIWSCHRIVLQNYVAAVTKRLQEMDGTSQQESMMINRGESNGGGPGRKERRKRESKSATKLPSLAGSKTISNSGSGSGSSRHSMGSVGSMRRSRGSREPRTIDEFSAAMSGAVKAHVDVSDVGLRGSASSSEVGAGQGGRKASPGFSGMSTDRLPTV